MCYIKRTQRLQLIPHLWGCTVLASDFSWDCSELLLHIERVHVCVCVQLNEELKQNLKNTMVKKYREKEGNEHITRAVDKLQQEVSGKDK